jgi:hypothetical protein
MFSELIHQTALTLCFRGGAKPVVDRWYTEFICEMLEKRYNTVANIPAEVWIGFRSAGSSEARWISESCEGISSTDFQPVISGILAWYNGPHGVECEGQLWRDGSLSEASLVSAKSDKTQGRA